MELIINNRIMDIKGKTALITGSTSGIGKATAELLASKDVNVIINSRTKPEEGEKFAKELSKSGVKTLYVQADVSKKEEVIELFKIIRTEFGHLDILINNASCQDPNDVFEEDEALWVKHFENDLLSTVMCSKEFAKLNNDNLRKIVSISSLYGYGDKTHKDFTAYGTAKAGVNSFTSTFCKNVAPNILVNCIAPGHVDTTAWEFEDKNEKVEIENEMLINRLIKPEEIAHAVLFLLENDAMLGQTIIVDGGLSLRFP